VTLLDVESLSVYYGTSRGDVRAVDDISLVIDQGEVVGLAGESGCGKTTAAYGILRLIKPPGRIIEGKVLLGGEDILRASKERLMQIRWKEIAMVFQGSMNALNPVHKVVDQLKEAILTHEDVSEKEAYERSLQMLELVGIPRDRTENYPHEFSGGMRQRAVIAMALTCNPKVLIADEPTTALDVVVQKQVLYLLKDLQRRLGLAVLLITHDLSVMAEITDRIAIMYAGKIAETSTAERLFEEPLHPYTKGLISSVLSPVGPRREVESIPGSPPDLIDPPSGCRFHPRCPKAFQKCRETPPVSSTHDGITVFCHLYR